MFESRRCLDEFDAMVNAARLVLPAAAGCEHLFERERPAAELLMVPGKAARFPEGCQQRRGQHAARAETGAFWRGRQQGNLNAAAEIFQKSG